MRRIRLLALDVDGTLTDGTINISENGELFKAFNVKDGMGIKNAADRGVVVSIITGRSSSIVEHRARELGITELHQNTADKPSVLKELCKKYDISPDEVAYVGDDLNDLDAISFSGVSFCPSDAAKEVMSSVDVVLKHAGGRGAVRECVDYLIEMKMI